MTTLRQDDEMADKEKGEDTCKEDEDEEDTEDESEEEEEEKDSAVGHPARGRPPQAPG